MGRNRLSAPYSEPPKPFYLINGTKQDPTAQISLVKALAVLKDSPAFKDVVLVSSDNEEFYVHSLILRSASPEFSRILDENKDISPSNPCRIEFKDCNAITLRCILDCLYEDKTTIEPTQISSLIAAARKYNIPVLRSACLSYLTQGVNNENALTLYNSLFASLPHLDFLMTYIRTHATAVFESKAFERLDEKQLIALLKDDNLMICEADVFKAVRRWAARKCANSGALPVTQDNLQSLLANVLPHIRFHHMSAQDIATCVSPSRLLPPHQLLELYTYIAQSLVDPSALPPLYLTPPRLGSSPLTWGFSARFCGRNANVRNTSPSFPAYNTLTTTGASHALGSMPLRNLACWRVTPQGNQNALFYVGVSTNTRFPDDSQTSPGVYAISKQRCCVNGQSLAHSTGLGSDVTFDTSEGIDVCFWPQRGILFAITAKDQQIVTMKVPIGPEYVAHFLTDGSITLNLKPIPVEKAYGNGALARLIYNMHISKTDEGIDKTANTLTE